MHRGARPAVRWALGVQQAGPGWRGGGSVRCSGPEPAWRRLGRLQLSSHELPDWINQEAVGFFLFFVFILAGGWGGRGNKQVGWGPRPFPSSRPPD